MAMAGIGGSGCPLVGQVLQNNRSLLELDVSYCRIPSGGVDSVASGLRENDVLQVFRVGNSLSRMVVLMPSVKVCVKNGVLQMFKIGKFPGRLIAWPILS